MGRQIQGHQSAGRGVESGARKIWRTPPRVPRCPIWPDERNSELRLRTRRRDGEGETVTPYQRERRSHLREIKISISTKVPSKWRFVDLETGDVWRWMEKENKFRGTAPQLLIDQLQDLQLRKSRP